MLFLILRLTEGDMKESVFSLLQVSKPCYSYALETKHMFSSRLLREPTCYLYPVTRRGAMTALFSSAFSLSLYKLPLIKRIKQSVMFSPTSIRRRAAPAPVCMTSVPDASPTYEKVLMLNDNCSKYTNTNLTLHETNFRSF